MGQFVISLDFELYWGVRDKRSLDAYAAHLSGAREVIPLLLDLFSQYQIQATFATVGFLFYKEKKQLLADIPSELPDYQLKVLSPYGNPIKQIGASEKDDPYHYASTLIKLIQARTDQEIGSHSFSHFYCLEKGASSSSFLADLKTTKRASASLNINSNSFVFPRNQYNERSLELLVEAGFTCYRSNEKSWLYAPKSGAEESQLRRLLRLIDAHINISGYHTYDLNTLRRDPLWEIPSSRFLRPYSSSNKLFRSLHLRRIKKAMTHAAKNGLMYHLWWHPHNFGVYQKENLQFLESILKHYQYLAKTYNFESINMGNLVQQLNHLDG